MSKDKNWTYEPPDLLKGATVLPDSATKVVRFNGATLDAKMIDFANSMIEQAQQYPPNFIVANTSDVMAVQIAILKNDIKVLRKKNRQLRKQLKELRASETADKDK